VAEQAGPGRPLPGQPPAPGARRPRRRRREDPQPLRHAIEGLLAERGWRAEAAAGALFGRWDQLVGPELAAHARPARYEGTELLVLADSAAWATQLRLLAATLVRRLNQELGDGTVTRVAVRGPAVPAQPGRWRARPARSPETGQSGTPRAP
jgi:predicted nucleic acid-binding Zn ribbon protein